MPELVPLPEIPKRGERYVNPNQEVFSVLSVHPPFRRRGWAVTLFNEAESRMHLVEMELLVKGGFEPLTVAHTAA